jgi:hypothetical protein
MATAGIKPGHESSRRHRGRLQPRDQRARRAEARHPGRDHAGAERHACGASGSDRIFAMMSVSRSHDSLPSSCGRGATMGPPACSAQSSPVVFRSCCCTRLQGLSASWDDWRGQKVFLIRKRSQVRVLDRPSAGNQEFAVSAQCSRFRAVSGSDGLGPSWGHTGPPAVYLRRKSARGFAPRARRCRTPRTLSAAC